MEQELVDVPMLVAIWHEDDVWNFSASDVPIVAYGDTVEEARGNFEETVDCHFQALAHYGKLQETVQQLRDVAADRNFYAARIQPRRMFEQFFVPQVGPVDLQAHALV